jgi:hypothetical protein
MIQPVTSPPDLRALRSRGEELLGRAEDLNEAGAPMDDLLSRRIARFAADVDRPVAGPPTPQAAVGLLFGLLDLLHRRLHPPEPRRRRVPRMPVRDRLLAHLEQAGPEGVPLVHLIACCPSTDPGPARRLVRELVAEGLVERRFPERAPGRPAPVGAVIAVAPNRHEPRARRAE